MASNWGINRIMAQVYALLYCAKDPLHTDQVMERLDISRGSASTNLRALVDWDLVEKTSVPGSRKDHYVAERDVWQVTARIIEKRERQEVRPIRERLQAVADHLVPQGQRLEDRPEADRQLHDRLDRLIDLIEVFEGVSEALLPLVRRRNEDLIRRLIDLARALDPPAPPSEPQDAAQSRSVSD
jgi:DNA-binding transcriptional regulator GbsR (MarR family)